MWKEMEEEEKMIIIEKEKVKDDFYQSTKVRSNKIMDINHGN